MTETWSNGERLYNLLPAIYRVRDVERGEGLRALLSVIESELEVLEADIEQLYDNWFIETCDEWAVAYIADLLGARLLHPIEGAATYSTRAYVANTLRYRRRKGTATVLEQLARDVTGWPARAVEFFQLLATTQHVNHVRLGNVRTDLHDTNQLELIGTPFEQAARTGEVRHIASSRGRYNIPNVGLFLYRLQSYAVTRSTPRPVSDPADGRYRFSPLGLDAPLFHRPRTETEITHLAEEVNVPAPLRRRALYDDLVAYHEALASGEGTPTSDYLDDPPVLEIFVEGQNDPLLPEEIAICNLDDWDAPGWMPPPSQIFTRADGSGFQTHVAVDPATGRLVTIDGMTVPQAVSFAYGFSSDVGGGPYNRQDALDETLTREITWQAGVSQEMDPVAGEIFGTLAEAVEAWNDLPDGTVGVIAILDSRTYQENLQGVYAIQVPQGSQLTIVAAHWPEEEVEGSLGAPGRRTGPGRKVGWLEPTDLRPHILGDVSVKGTAGDGSANPGELVLNGLLIEGRLRILSGNLGSLQIVHSTLVPGEGGLLVGGSKNTRLEIGLKRSICGGIKLSPSVPSLSVVDAIIDGIIDKGSGQAILAPGADVQVETSTVLGRSAMRSLRASESIFTDLVIVERRQVGCVRFSHVPLHSKTPRRYRCQPDMALESIEDAGQAESITLRLTPQFTSMTYGDPGYVQLGRTCAKEIHTGAEDDAEMGVFSHLKQPQREANLRAALDEYLRFGLEAGIFYIT